MIWYIVGLLAAIWVIHDVVTKQKKFSDTQKFVWIICAVFFSIITAIVYYFKVKRK